MNETKALQIPFDFFLSPTLSLIGTHIDVPMKIIRIRSAVKYVEGSECGKSYINEVAN